MMQDGLEWSLSTCDSIFLVRENIFLHTCVLKLYQTCLAAVGIVGFPAGHHNHQAPGAALGLMLKAAIQLVLSQRFSVA